MRRSDAERGPGQAPVQDDAPVKKHPLETENTPAVVSRVDLHRHLLVACERLEGLAGALARRVLDGAAEDDDVALVRLADAALADVEHALAVTR